jgi:hypothetical protein
LQEFPKGLGPVEILWSLVKLRDYLGVPQDGPQPEFPLGDKVLKYVRSDESIGDLLEQYINNVGLTHVWL